MGIETPYRAVRTAVGRKRWRHKGHLLRAAMPALAQIIVLTALLLQRQWLFADGLFRHIRHAGVIYPDIHPRFSASLSPDRSYESDGACELITTT